MIGGGDQIYNDAVMKQTTLFQEWLSINNPHRKHEAQFSPQMQDELENFYLDRYSMWFSQGLFGMANAQIPMINMWDDHGEKLLASWYRIMDHSVLLYPPKKYPRIALH